MEIGKAFGYQLENAIESRVGRGYFTDDGRDLQTLFNTSEVYSSIKGRLLWTQDTLAEQSGVDLIEGRHI